MILPLLRTATEIALAIYAANKIIEKKMDSPDLEIYSPIDTVSIIVPSLNEEKLIKQCLQSIRSQTLLQEYPEYFEILLADSGSTDNTVNIAEPYVDRIINCSKGKLSARNEATYESVGNIIVSVDSDTYYPSPLWLNTLLRPFNDIYFAQEHNIPYPIVGSVGSTYDSTIPGVPTTIRNFLEVSDRYIIHPNQMVGRNSAYYKYAFYLSGMFDTTIDQLDVKEMIKEEEQSFGERLSKIGTVVLQFGAKCIHLGGSRIGCRIGTEPSESESCKDISVERFG